jgi:hypothetical protein
MALIPTHTWPWVQDMPAAAAAPVTLDLQQARQQAGAEAEGRAAQPQAQPQAQQAAPEEQQHGAAGGGLALVPAPALQ